MSRDYKLYLKDILESIEKIENYVIEISFEEFISDALKYDGIVKNIEIIGEAIKHIPTEVKARHNKVEWKKIIGTRDILIHSYFRINSQII